MDEVRQEEGDMPEDNIQGRDFTDALVGKKVKALYEKRMVHWEYQYFSTVLKWHTLIKHLTN